MNAIHGASYRQKEQWRIAAYLGLHGSKSGDEVAVINTYNFAGFCTWAELDGLRIVAEIASDPFDYVHWQTSLALFWGSSAATQKKVYQTFRQVAQSPSSPTSSQNNIPPPAGKRSTAQNSGSTRLTEPERHQIEQTNRRIRSQTRSLGWIITPAKPESPQKTKAAPWPHILTN